MIVNYYETSKWLRQSAKNCSMMDIDCANCAGDDCEGHEQIVFLEAADAIEELLAAVPKWISVRDVSDEEICAAKMVLSVIENLDHPMLMYDIEKSAVKKALILMLRICEAEPPKEVCDA